MTFFEECDRDIDAVDAIVPRVDPDCLYDIRFLNKGKFGHVRLVRLKGGLASLRQKDSRDSSNPIEDDHHHHLFLASKTVNLYAPDPLDAAKQLANEARILSRLHHENVIKLKGVCSEGFSESFDNSSRGYFLLFDILDATLKHRLWQWRREKGRSSTLFKKLRFKGSSIHQKLFNRLSCSSAPEQRHYQECEREEMYNRIQDADMIGIARGLEYLHSQQIILRDLKPANIGYYRNWNNSNGGEWTVKLIDFGMAQNAKECESGEIRGSLAYIAPEAMLGKRPTLKVDVFSFGVVLSEVCSLILPYIKSRRKPRKLSNKGFYDEMCNKIGNGELKPMNNLERNLPCPKVRALVEECWDVPANRPTCTDIVAALESVLSNPNKHIDDAKLGKYSHDFTETCSDDMEPQKRSVWAHSI